MSETTKAVIKVAVFAVVAIVLANFLIGLVVGIFKALVPILILGAIGYVAFKAFAPKAIGGGSRRILP